MTRQTYTLVYAAFASRDPGRAEDQIIGVARDGDEAEIDRLIRDFKNAAGDYRAHMSVDRQDNPHDDWPIETQTGLILTDEAPADPDRIFWRGDVPGVTLSENYEYAILARDN